MAANIKTIPSRHKQKQRMKQLQSSLINQQHRMNPTDKQGAKHH
jgi:hypothetical protein